MQFHLPPATSLLRLHAPGNYDDDLSGFRPMVVAVNQDHAAAKGMEIAFTGPALFGVAPVRDPAGEYIGTFEVGIAFGPILDNLKVAYGLEFALFIEEDLLNPEGVAKEVFGDQNRLGKYVKYHSTHWDLMQQLVSAADLARLEEPVRYARSALDVPYGVVLVPLRGSTGAPLGIMAVAKNFDASRAASGRSLVWQGLLALFGVVTLAGVIQVVVRGFLVRPLAVMVEGFKGLADGDAAARVDDPTTLCDELRALAAQHERLRAALEARDGAVVPDQDGAP
jgi:methyl-accepting chemotaxis protein